MKRNPRLRRNGVGAGAGAGDDAGARAGAGAGPGACARAAGGRAAGGLAVLVAIAATAWIAPGSAAAESPYVFAVTTDYSVSGNCARIDLASPWTTQTGLQAVCSDPVVRYCAYDNKIYVVNRFGCDNIQVLDPAHGFTTIREFSVGAGTNPQDIAFAGATKAYVSRYEVATLLIVNPATGAMLGSINLGAFADGDGIPEMGHMVVDGNRLFVALERIDRSTWTPVSPAYLAVIDMTTDTIVDANPGLPGTQAIALTGANPNTELQLDSAAHLVYVGEMGQYGLNDGGIEKVNSSALTTAGWLIRETRLGGDVGPFAVTAGKGYAVVSTDGFLSGEIARFSTTDSMRTGTLYSTQGYMSDLEFDAPSAQLFVSDRFATAPGVQVFSTTTDTRLTASPISTGLPPVDLVVVRPVATGVAGGAGPAFIRAAPNPFVDATHFAWAAGAAAPRAIELFDIGGRRIRRLEAGAAGGIDWDGRDEASRPVPPGVYLYRAEGDGGTTGGRVVRLR